MPFFLKEDGRDALPGLAFGLRPLRIKRACEGSQVPGIGSARLRAGYSRTRTGGKEDGRGAHPGLAFGLRAKAFSVSDIACG